MRSRWCLTPPPGFGAGTQTYIDWVVDTICAIAPAFGGINLEDIKAPECFAIEARLKERLDIPVMHDDQHGTAIAALAALINAAKVVKKDFKKLKVVISGAGAAGTAIAKLLFKAGIKDIIVLDSKGIIDASRDEAHKKELAGVYQPAHYCGRPYRRIAWRRCAYWRVRAQLDGCQRGCAYGARRNYFCDGKPHAGDNSRGGA